MKAGQVAMWAAVVAADTIVETKKVVFRPSTSGDTLRVGDLVCYNSDLAADWKERTTNPITGQFNAGNETTYAEGAQTYSGRFLIVEKPASGNLLHFAGVVVSLGVGGGVDGDLIEIAIPKEGAVVPVWTSANCVINTTVLGIASSSYIATAVTGDGDPVPVGVAVETVDRSSTNGLVWMRMFGQAGIGVERAYFAPTRYSATSGREYGIKIDGDNFFVGTTAAQSYLLEVSGDKTGVSTGDAYSALIHISGSNYAANDTSYTYRGLNCSISNRTDGTMGQMYGANIAISLKSGSGAINSEAIACQIDAQDLSAAAKGKFGGLDVAINREGLAATEEFGIRVRTRGTINTAMNTVFRIDKDATDHGFVNLFNIEADAVDYAACTGDVTVDSNDKVIPIVLGGSTFYLIAVDSIPAG